MSLLHTSMMDQYSSSSKMYFIAVVLPPQLDEKIRAYKVQMQKKYGCKVGLKSPAHLTIVPPFWMEEEKEESLRMDMGKIAQTFPVFAVTTANFSAFAPRTIFIATEKSPELAAVKKAADIFFRSAGYKMKTENRPFHPHITIATRDLHKKDFADAMLFFGKENFRETFTAYGLSLLRHNGSIWDVVFTANFTAAWPTGSAKPPKIHPT